MKQNATNNIIGLMLTAAVCMAFTFTSCDFERSKNGDLDGYWHLIYVDSIANNKTADLSERRIFWSVEHNLMQLVDYDAGLGHYGFLARFKHSASTLRIYDIHYHDRPNGDPILENVEEVASLGINSLDETFTVETLSKKYMTLSNNQLRLSFRKQ